MSRHLISLKVTRIYFTTESLASGDDIRKVQNLNSLIILVKSIIPSPNDGGIEDYFTIWISWSETAPLVCTWMRGAGFVLKNVPTNYESMRVKRMDQKPMICSGGTLTFRAGGRSDTYRFLYSAKFNSLDIIYSNINLSLSIKTLSFRILSPPLITI